VGTIDNGEKNLEMSLKSKVEKGFLRSGTAKGAVPPVEMTNLGCGMKWRNPTSAKLNQPMGIA